MSVTVRIPMPTIESVVPLSDYKIRVKWNESLRPHSVEEVDLEPLIETLKFYKPLRGNRKLFRTVHIVEDGDAIAWGNDEIDMAATSIERLAEESMTADEFKAFLSSNSLTRQRAATALGRSPRQIAYYITGQQPIPRILVLACYGYISRQQQGAGGMRGGSNVVIGLPKPFARTITVGHATVPAA
jgi:hypothetical protein